VANAFSAALLISALLLSGFLIADGVSDLWLGAREHERERAHQPAPTPPSDTPANQREQPRPDFADAPREPIVKTVAMPDVAEGNAPATEQPPAATLCDAGVRLSGSAYVRPGSGKPFVMFSGPDVRRGGLRSVGGRVAGKTVVAIHPDAVVLRDAQGRDCWIKMSSEHARDVVDAERRAHARRLIEARREERRKRAAERRAAKAAKR
jgi:hypothetical protein